MNLGLAGERFVALWLVQRGWRLGYHRWRSALGEIDLIAYDPGDRQLVFVEVKARRGGNWDTGGLEAVNGPKQAKLIQTAQEFLAHHSQWADFPCRFDVALVACWGQTPSVHPPPKESWAIAERVDWEGYCLSLEAYLKSAF